MYPRCISKKLSIRPGSVCAPHCKSPVRCAGSSSASSRGSGVVRGTWTPISMADPEAPPPVVPPSEADLTMRVVDAETPRTPSVPTVGEKKTPSFLVKVSAESMSAQSSTQNYDDLLSSMGAEQASEELDPIVMAQDVEILKGRLRSMGRGLLDPLPKLMQYWDFFTLSALFFTSTITPYEVCLMWEETKFADPNWATPPNGPLFVINWIVNLIFMIDICFNFFLPYKESIKKGGGLVKSHRKIAKNYICGWFPLDFVSVIPVDNIMMAVDTSQLRGASSSAPSACCVCCASSSSHASCAPRASFRAGRTRSRSRTRRSRSSSGASP